MLTAPGQTLANRDDLPVVHLPANISADRFCSADTVYAMVSNNTTVAAGVTVAVAPGTVFKLAGRWLVVDGTLVLQMTNIAPWGEEARAVRTVVRTSG